MKTTKFHFSVVFVCIYCFLLYNNVQAQISTPDWALTNVYGYRFSDGLANTKNKSGWGFIDCNGKEVIPGIYRIPSQFNRGFAVVMNSDGQNGIIDRNGKYILEPGEFEITAHEEIPGFYIIKNRESELSAVFSKGQFLTGFDYDLILMLPENYPFVKLRTKDNYNSVLNLLSMEIIDDCEFTNYAIDGFVVYDKLGNWRGYSPEGNPIDRKLLLTSSDDTEVFKDEYSGKFGIRNIQTGKIIVSPKYSLPSNMDKNRIWYNGTVELGDSLSPKQKYVQTIINQKGQTICAPDTSVLVMRYPHFICIVKDFDDPKSIKYIDYSGKMLKQLNGYQWLHSFGHFYWNTEGMIYDGATKQVDNNIQLHQLSENVLLYKNRKTEQYFYRNLDTNQIIGPFDEAHKFNEGIGVVKRNGENFLVDKTGKEYHFSYEIEFRDAIFNEGVIPISMKSPYANGYIYNPLGHQGYVYNDPNFENLDELHARIFFNNGLKVFDKENYVKAMDLFHQALTLKPDYNEAFNNYAACLYNLRHYDEALTACEIVLDKWPDDEYARNLYNKTVDKLRSQEASSGNDLQSSNTTIWDVLDNFANSMLMMKGGMPSSNYNYDSYNASSSYSQTSSGNYQSQYEHWARRVEYCYNSLTNLGYSEMKNGDRKGGSGKGKVSSGNYVAQKRSLREAQNEMRSIRRKAAKVGVNIPQSPWETASVSY